MSPFALLHFGIAVAMSVTAADSPPAQQAFERAIALCGDADEAGARAALQVALDAETQYCQRARLEAAFHTGLRDRPEFRRAVQDAAVAHGISRLDLAPADEPGECIEIEGRVVDAQEQRGEALRIEMHPGAGVAQGTLVLPLH